ncbi:AbrB/MazE/SpoVT family DNA-binding domain-containing protein [Corynebacterium glyciniphilum]|uniref:AbrB/MazE/SpoVT family DNA-binding domain-containing protein n=1 Tax=Corynebacterium glyciniphilum TaxID=1404244 RepID=UPI00264E0E90|nr:AbrB/MazE/SpoVT family DNA-binding domain-containing protein [Corynebacterium glyciniphilum]MDN5684532.1 AbrB/MazE/SpoVT family DNA-binding domain-containing protein [Corynebacterium glyciniphilum]MDN6706559.1 AbrB/MazE/SpoVT family DNA-binding domain-containing protein [Corynebacterium glyciniphilum]
MRLNSNGQVTIPPALRDKFGFVEGDDVEVVADGDPLRIVHAGSMPSRGEQIVRRMRGQATTSRIEELRKLLRDERDD